MPEHNVRASSEAAPPPPRTREQRMIPLIVGCALFRADTPVWLMVTVLLVGGLFRSLQFTAVNTLTYADLDSAQMSRASRVEVMWGFAVVSLMAAASALSFRRLPERAGSQLRSRRR